MNRSIRYQIALSALLAISPCAALVAGEQPAASSMGRGGAVLVTVTASVEAITLTNREVTLKGPLGNTATFTVDPRVKRLEEVKVGDFVRADYFIALAAEVRKPTADEEKNPLTVVEDAARTPAGATPGAVAGRRIKVVATVEGLDRPTKTVTVKGPGGHYLTARVADPARLTEVRIGETVVITCTEAVAISLEKVEKKTAE